NFVQTVHDRADVLRLAIPRCRYADNDAYRYAHYYADHGTGEEVPKPPLLDVIHHASNEAILLASAGCRHGRGNLREGNCGERSDGQESGREGHDGES